MRKFFASKIGKSNILTNVSNLAILHVSDQVEVLIIKWTIAYNNFKWTLQSLLDFRNNDNLKLYQISVSFDLQMISL